MVGGEGGRLEGRGAGIREGPYVGGGEGEGGRGPSTGVGGEGGAGRGQGGRAVRRWWCRKTTADEKKR